MLPPAGGQQAHAARHHSALARDKKPRGSEVGATVAAEKEAEARAAGARAAEAREAEAKEVGVMGEVGLAAETTMAVG